MKMELFKILENYRNTVLKDEDGDNIHLEFNDPINSTQIVQFEKNNGVSLPLELKEFFKKSDGLDLFGVELMSLAEIQYMREYDAFTLHNWGNGDFDYIDKSGRVFFLDRYSEQLILVGNTLQEWAQSVIEEIEREGALAHPDDYTGKRKKGTYFQVYEELKKMKRVQGKIKSKPVSEKTDKIKADPKQILAEISKDSFRVIEQRIAFSNNVALHQPPKLESAAEYACKNIDQSIFDIEEVISFVYANEKQLLAFTNIFFKYYPVKGLIPGFSLLYAIYLLYLQNKNEQEFLEFLKQRSIPKVEDFLKEIKRVYAERQKR